MSAGGLDYRHFELRLFQAWLTEARARAETVHGVATSETSLPVHETGRFDGLEVWLQECLDPEMKLFVFLHIFGHVVQWNISAKWRRVGLERFGPHNVDAAVLRLIRSYERRASAYGLSLLHGTGVKCLDQWLSDWSDADWRYLRGLYLEGGKPDPQNSFKEKFLRYGRRRLAPVAIPHFQPRRWEDRVAF